MSIGLPSFLSLAFSLANSLIATPKCTTEMLLRKSSRTALFSLCWLEHSTPYHNSATVMSEMEQFSIPILSILAPMCQRPRNKATQIFVSSRYFIGLIQWEDLSGLKLSSFPNLVHQFFRRFVILPCSIETRGFLDAWTRLCFLPSANGRSQQCDKFTFDVFSQTFQTIPVRESNRTVRVYCRLHSLYSLVAKLIIYCECANIRGIFNFDFALCEQNANKNSWRKQTERLFLRPKSEV